MNFQVAAYIRLSREDGDKIESDSVANQRLLLHEFICRREELKLIDTYVDDGWSGTNFKRPSFCRMIEDIEKGKINCVIVKDLSRFGRDYLETGQYLERYFPEHNIRFISVVDGIDSEKRQYDLMMPIKNLFNEQYARDISKKVHAAVRTKQEAGQFIGAFASYGYQKSPDNKNKLVLDPYAAEIVKKIFAMYGEGYSKNHIARWLNEHHILCPSEYKKQNGERYRNGNCLKSTAYWTYSTVYKILQNEMYVGNMVQGKKYQEMHRKQKTTKKEEWVVVKQTQEAIIDQETWDRTQRLLQKQTRVMGRKGKNNRFAGLLRCADCGRMLVKKGEGTKSRYYCGTYIRSGRAYCTPHIVPYTALMEVIQSDFETIFPVVLEEWKKIRENVLEEKKKKREIRYRKVEAEYEKVLRMKREIYEDFKKGILTEEERGSYSEMYRKKEQLLREEMDSLAENKKDDLRDWQRAEGIQSIIDEGLGQDKGILDEKLAQNKNIIDGKLDQNKDMQDTMKVKVLMNRAILSEMIEEILIAEGRIQIIYRF